MSKELITVVTVCFNAGQTIAKTMQSVLNQTYRPLEYILVDGKSTDNTLNIIYELEPLFHEKGIAVRIVSEKDKGIFDAMNKGVKLANGRWVNFMNAGDVFYNDKTIDFVFSHEIPMEVKLVYGRYFEAEIICCSCRKREYTRSDSKTHACLPSVNVYGCR